MRTNILLTLILLACGRSSQFNRMHREVSPLALVIYRNNSAAVADAQALTPEQAKAIVVARFIGVDSPGSGSGPSASVEYSNIQDIVYEVRQVHDGWYVFCHGPHPSHGNSVHIDKLWRISSMAYGDRSEVFDNK